MKDTKGMNKEIPWVNYCESEPLAHSGAIQPHGGLFYLDTKRSITHASANLGEYLPYIPGDLIGLPLPVDLQDILTNSLDKLAAESGSRTELFGVSIPDRLAVDFVISRSQQGVVIELSKHDHRLAKVMAYSVPMKTPSTAESALELHQLIAQLQHDLTGFDRVMIYVFRDDGDGEVVAEARNATVYGSYMGLRFPASDIPLVARKLYEVNPWRLIPDSQIQPIPILGHQDIPPDLTWSDLRSVSPVHQSYLANMGVRASLSVPIMAGGELWGLLACHHAEPRALPLKILRASNQICKYYGLLIATWIAEERMRFVEKLDSYYAALRIAMTSEDVLISSIPEISPVLYELFKVSGLAIGVGNVWAHTGDAPNSSKQGELSEWFESVEDDSVVLIDNLSRTIPSLSKLPVAGALAVKLQTKNQGTLQLWLYRKELIYEVDWGGNPDKPMEFHEGKIGIAPRRSFDKYVEKRKDFSSPWTREDRLAAKRLRQLLTELYA
jgi:light-regulated signal transduction histidine kinase (bacteriophytochrome)